MNEEHEPYHDSIRVPCDSTFLSFPSEPENVRNWFPSYEYESPTPEAVGGSDFRNLLVRGNNNLEAIEGGKNKRKYKLEEIYRDTRVEECVNSTSNDFEVSDSLCSTWLPSEPPDIKIWFPGYVYESPGLGTSDFFGVERESDIENTDVARKDTEMADFVVYTEPEMKKEGLDFDEKISPRSEHEYQNNLDLHNINGDGLVKLTTSRNDGTKLVPENFVREIKKENDGKNSSENGFISTKNKINEVKGEIIMRKQKEVNVSSFLFPAGIYSVEKRQKLSNVTNIRYSGGHEISGKWQCTKNRKLKPGPSLKQVGLEKWVRRL